MRTILRILLFFALLALLGSCHKDDNVEETGTTVTLGVLLPLTGSGSSTGESCQASLNIALEDINNYLAGCGCGLKLKLHVEDTGTDTAFAKEKLGAFLLEGIQLVIGPYSSAEVQACKPLADTKHLLLVSPSSVAVSLAIPDDNIFRLVPSDLSQGEAMTALLNFDSIRAIVPVVRNDVWGNDLLGSTSADFIAAGGIVSEPVLYDPSTTDYTAIAASVESKVQALLNQYAATQIGVYLVSFSEGTGILNASGFLPPLGQVSWYGSSAYANNSTLLNNKAAASFAFGRHFSCPIFGLDENAKIIWQPLSEKIRQAIGRDPEIYALAAYDAAWIAALTYITAGSSPSIEKLKYIFTAEAAKYFGATGWTRLNEAGDREFANYDFWGLAETPNLSQPYEWTIVARYNSATHTLTH